MLKSIFSGRMRQEIIFYEEMELFNKVGPEEIECSQADRQGKRLTGYQLDERGWSINCFGDQVDLIFEAKKIANQKYEDKSFKKLLSVIQWTIADDQIFIFPCLLNYV